MHVPEAPNLKILEIQEKVAQLLGRQREEAQLGPRMPSTTAGLERREATRKLLRLSNVPETVVETGALSAEDSQEEARCEVDDEMIWNFEIRRRRRAEPSAEVIAPPTPKPFRDSFVEKLRTRLRDLEINPILTESRPGGMWDRRMKRLMQKTNPTARQDDEEGGVMWKGNKQRNDVGITKWVDTPSQPLFAPEPINELETNVPQQDLHLYQLYCNYNNTVIIFRPVSDAVPDLYAGNFFLDPKFCDAVGQPIPQPHLPLESVLRATRHECRVKGKSISVSLKSSSYAPICGLIPVNPALSKAYIDAQRREREIEDLILNAKGGVVTIALLKKLKAQKSQAGNLTQTFRRDIERSLESSNATCAALLQQYKEKLVQTVDKASVSQSYIDQFNDAQFLGTTNAQWRGLAVYYAEVGGDVLRDGKERPVFYIENNGKFYEFQPEHNDVAKVPTSPEVVAQLKPVLVVTHRMFFTSSTTQRIEEEEQSYLIGPDFDGLCYANHRSDLPHDEYCEWAEEMLNFKWKPSFGLVNQFDIHHIRDVRQFTAWKQNHGYESSNTVKTQNLSPGVYTVITPHTISMLNNVIQIIGFYRSAWLAGYPLVLNPNWRVAIGSDGLPRLYGDDLVLPATDDLGMGGLMHRLESSNGGPTLASLQSSYVTLNVRSTELEKVKKSGTSVAALTAAATAAHATFGKKLSDEDFELSTHAHLVFDRKHLIQLFFAIRRWQLFPTRFVDGNESSSEEETDDEEEEGETESSEDGGEALFPCPLFEEFRRQKVEEAQIPFDTAANEFVILHGKTQFLDTLLDFISPAPDNEFNEA